MPFTSAKQPGYAYTLARGLAVLSTTLVVIATTGLLAPNAPSAAARSSAEARPNIVMLMTDDQTASSLRFLPTVRKVIGGQGVTFSNAFVTSPLCCPSRATYFTGQYPHNNGVLFNHGPHGGYAAFKGHARAFPAALQRVGYRTAHIGKYLNGYSARLGVPRGWTEFYGAFDPWTYDYYGFRLTHNGRILRFAPSERNYNTTVFTRLATGLIRRWAGKGPFFINVAFLAPHSAGPGDKTLKWEPAPVSSDPREINYRLAVPPRRYRGHFARLALPRPPSFDELDAPHAPWVFQSLPDFRPFTPADIRDITARYHAQLESLLAVDDAVGRIVSALRQTGQLNHTLILFTSDNGFFNGEHRIRADKYYVYDPATHVPLLMRGPGILAGITRPQPVANVDLAPTMLDGARARPLTPPDGMSLLPLIRDRYIQQDRDLLIETAPNDVYLISYHAVRTPHFLYVEYDSGDRELFDLNHDPDELHNMADSPTYGTAQHSLQATLRRLERCAGASCRNPLPQ